MNRRRAGTAPGMTTFEAVSLDLRGIDSSQGGTGWRATAREWVEAQLGTPTPPDMIFARDIPDTEWVGSWGASGYSTATFVGEGQQVDAAVLWRTARVQGEPLVVEGAELAGARLTLDGSDRPLVALSVHAGASGLADTIRGFLDEGGAELLAVGYLDVRDPDLPGGLAPPPLPGVVATPTAAAWITSADTGTWDTSGLPEGARPDGTPMRFVLDVP